MIRQIPNAVTMAVVLLHCFGCNTSRYGLSYDERFPHIKRVAVLPIQVDVVSIHAGGDPEPRPDLVPEIRENLLTHVDKLVTEKGYKVKVEKQPVAAPIGPTPSGQSHALLSAIDQAILIHHYQQGKALQFDYTMGSTVSRLGADNCDAILYVKLVAAVPTPGRQAVAVTAFVMGFLTGIHVAVKTDEAHLVLMLIDPQTGNVLWYNWRVAKMDVRNDDRLNGLVENVGKYLLRPRED